MPLLPPPNDALAELAAVLGPDNVRTLVRTFLRELPDMHPFVEAYVMLYGFEGNAMPIDDLMLGYLKEEEVVEPAATLDEAQKFVEHYFKAEEYHDLFYVIREAALAAGDDAKKKRKK